MTKYILVPLNCKDVQIDRIKYVPFHCLCICGCSEINVREPNRQSRLDKPETLATLDTRHRTGWTLKR